MSEGKKVNGESVIKNQTDSDKFSKESSQSSSSRGSCGSSMPEINFATFIFSLNSSALVHLGIIDDPASGSNSKNIAMAKQTIDILAMLQEKTLGNLSSDEENMLKSMLYDLRILYVKEKG
jgi:hypothetical protein